MYRKILFIGVNFITIEVFSKATLLLFFSYTSGLLTIYFQPFITSNLNSLELFSNLSVTMTLYGGSIYLQQDLTNEFVKVILFFGILFINIFFGVLWTLSTFQIFFHKHVDFFRKYLPNLTKIIIFLENYLLSSRYKWFISRNESSTKTKNETNLEIKALSKKIIIGY